jgi:hypothetical protein
MCDFLQTDMRRPEPIQTVKDIVQLEYKIYYKSQSLEELLYTIKVMRAIGMKNW